MSSSPPWRCNIDRYGHSSRYAISSIIHIWLSGRILMTPRQRKIHLCVF
jgi:hypothetical protein